MEKEIEAMDYIRITDISNDHKICGKRKCYYCEKTMPPIHNWRKNGKIGQDWANRHYCKKCFIYIKKQQQFIIERSYTLNLNKSLFGLLTTSKYCCAKCDKDIRYNIYSGHVLHKIKSRVVSNMSYTNNTRRINIKNIDFSLCNNCLHGHIYEHSNCNHIQDGTVGLLDSSLVILEWNRILHDLVLEQLQYYFRPKLIFKS
jgi:hypothetical protein